MALSALALATAPVSAQTTVPGTIETDTVWGADGSPYLVHEDVVVRNGARLRIGPGVTVFMGAGTSLVVEEGTLLAEGRADAPILVRSDRVRQGLAGAAGDWKQWVFGPGSADTQFDYVSFEHGSGLRIHDVALVLNHVDLRHHLGAAITADLNASLSGAGNSASGNTLNGILVPSGDITSNVQWALQGIPYVVSSGTVSVGVSPLIDSVTPGAVEQGQKVTLTLEGRRLETLSGIRFDRAGLAATIFSGGSPSQRFAEVTADAGAIPGPASLSAVTDAGEIALAGAFHVIPPQPALTGLDPATVMILSGATDIGISGRNFTAASEALFDSVAMPTRFISASAIVATLPAQSSAGSLDVQVRTPDATQDGQYALSNILPLRVEAPAPPIVSVSPTPVAFPPDNHPREIVIRLSKADYRDNTLSLAVTDASRASVSPASVTIPAGQTEIRVTLTGHANGTTALVIDSATLARVSVPLYITADFQAVNTAYASPVGVLVDMPASEPTQEIMLVPREVGVAIGGVLTAASPRIWTRNSEFELVIGGAGIPADANVSIIPPAGIGLGTPAVDAEGRRLTVMVNVAAEAPSGARRIVVQAAHGREIREILFADPAISVVEITPDAARIDSVDPLFGLPGSMVKLKVRGRNLHGGRLSLEPGTGLRIDAAPVISAAGDTLEAYVEILPEAPLTEHVVRVTTSAGTTPEIAAPSNTFHVAASASGTATHVSSALVGVMVVSDTEAVTRTETPVSPLIGVLVGTGVASVHPATGVVGNDVTVVVRGRGLNAVDGIAFTPGTGLLVPGEHTTSDEGTELRFDVRIDAEAELGAHRLTLLSGDRPVTFSRPADSVFMVSPPMPELLSVIPPVLLAGAPPVKLVVAGQHLRNIEGIRVEPADGIEISGPFETNTDGSALSFTITVSADAASGERAVIVTTLAGESATVVHPGNLLHIAHQLGNTYAAIASPAVGVVITGEAPSPSSVESTVASAPVGVVVTGSEAEISVSHMASSPAVGVIVGAAAVDRTPDGWLRGASGTMIVTGYSLDHVANVIVAPDTGLILGLPAAAPDGKQLSIPISVAPDAGEGLRSFRLFTEDGHEVHFIEAQQASFGIGSLPIIHSVAPIVLEQGARAQLGIRGTGLQRIRAVELTGPSDVQVFNDEIIWTRDGLGELLTVPLRVGDGAVPGVRVLRLRVYGGATTDEQTPANTLTIVAPR